TLNAMRNSKLIVHTESGIPDGCSCIQRYIASQFVLQARRRQNGVKQPLRRNFPAHAYGRKDRIFSFHIDAYSENELQIRAVNVRPADEERHVEIIPKQMAESRNVVARLSFPSEDNRIGTLHVKYFVCS